MSNHTPGPWGYTFFTTGVDEADRVDCFITQRGVKADNDIDLIATVSKITDARLIAAAPELVDKFREALRIITTQTPQHKINEFLKGAAELLRRIEGEEEAP